jgi:hypothetical protein
MLLISIIFRNLRIKLLLLLLALTLRPCCNCELHTKRGGVLHHEQRVVLLAATCDNMMYYCRTAFFLLGANACREFCPAKFLPLPDYFGSLCLKTFLSSGSSSAKQKQKYFEFNSCFVPCFHYFQTARNKTCVFLETTRGGE